MITKDELPSTHAYSTTPRSTRGRITWPNLAVAAIGTIITVVLLTSFQATAAQDCDGGIVERLRMGRAGIHLRAIIDFPGARHDFPTVDGLDLALEDPQLPGRTIFRFTLDPSNFVTSPSRTMTHTIPGLPWRIRFTQVADRPNAVRMVLHYESVVGHAPTFTTGVRVFIARQQACNRTCTSWKIKPGASFDRFGASLDSVPSSGGAVSLAAMASPTSATCGREIAEDAAVVLVNGLLQRTPAKVGSSDEVLITNGLLRLHLVDGANIASELRVRDAWVPGTSTVFGDYTFMGSIDLSNPTSIEVLESAPEEVSVEWTFADHIFDPTGLGLSGGPYEIRPYPYTKRIWFRAGEPGYYAFLDPLEPFPETYQAEHEIGFGGLWGPGELRTHDVQLNLGNPRQAVELNADNRLDAAEFRWGADNLRRVLVPLPGAPIITPNFDADQYGSTWVHIDKSAPFGAYLYAAPLGEGLSARDVCIKAWTEAPFGLPPYTVLDLVRCGPEPW